MASAPCSALSPGGFVVFSPKPQSFLSRISFGSFSSPPEKVTAGRIEQLLRRAEKRPADVRTSTQGALGAATWTPEPVTYAFGGGAAVVVSFGQVEVSGQFVGQSVEPSVHYDADREAACVFQGYLSNMDDLLERHGGIAGLSLRAQDRDLRQVAAEIIYHLYCRDADPLVLLSELQGQYCFVLYDTEKHQLFAARDSSGSEPLFYEIDDDGGLCVSNQMVDVPAEDGVGRVRWSELPAGHFISGRVPKVQQFALTPQQLSMREYYENLDDDISPRHAARMEGGSRSTNSSACGLAVYQQ